MNIYMYKVLYSYAIFIHTECDDAVSCREDDTESLVSCQDEDDHCISDNCEEEDGTEARSDTVSCISCVSYAEYEPELAKM